MKKRFIFNLDEKEYLKIKFIAEQEKISMAEMLRRALLLYWVKVAEPKAQQKLAKAYEKIDERNGDELLD